MSEDDPRSGEQSDCSGIEGTERGKAIERADEPTFGRTYRRRYLQMLGAAGLLGLGAAGTAAGVQSGSSSDRTVVVPEENTDWEAAADARIREYRTADLTVELVDANGDPVDGEVAIEMQEHAYGFGTAVNAGTLIDESEPGDNYREYIPELFNKGVMENQTKWRFWEDDPDLADAAIEWVVDQGLDIRGHVCLWGSVSSYAVPNDVVEAMGVEWEDGGVTDPDLDPDYVVERSTEHVPEIIDYYGDTMEEWEIYNEALHATQMVEAIEGGEIPEDAEYSAWTAPIIAEWYEIGQNATPEGVPIATNDYSVLAGGYESERERYREQIEFLLDNDIDLGSIGMQCHFGQSETLTPAETIDGLNGYAVYGADLKVTEFDTSDEDWDPEAKADFLYEFLKTVFSHPATTDFIMWGFWDGRHWLGNAPLFEEDWSRKPAYDVYTGLLFDQWWTDVSGSTDTSTYQIDLVAGGVEDELGEDHTDFYSRQNRLIQYAHVDNGDVTAGRTSLPSLDDAIEAVVSADDISVNNGTATVTITHTGEEPITLSMAAYTLPDGEFSFENAADQELIGVVTETLDPGEHTLELPLPGPGEFATSAFLGEHRLTVAVDGEELETTVSLDEPGERTLTIETDEMAIVGND